MAPPADDALAAPPAGVASPLAVDGLTDLDALDCLAQTALTTGLPARLTGTVDQLLVADLDGHPWSQLLVAAACHDAHRGDDRAIGLWTEAWGRFEVIDDEHALGVAANVRANLELGRGDIPSAVSWWGRAEGLLGRRGDIAIGAAAHSSLAAYAAGDLSGAEQQARDALLMADAAGSPGDVVVPLVYLSLYAFCLGDFERCLQLLRQAEVVLATLSEPRNETALVLGFTGVLEAVWGRQADADRFFADALRRAEADEAPWYALMVRSLRAEHTASWAPHRSLKDARQAQAEAEALGDAWWFALARHAEGVALAELGELDDAREALGDAIGLLSNPVERGFAQIALGEVLLGLGERPAARSVLEDARTAFESSGARYWATRASLALASADRDRGGRWVRLARSTAVDHPAYDRLFSPAQDLRINVLGPPAVLLDGRRVEFLTRHAELATYLLAIAGPIGIPPGELASVLWPGVDQRRAQPRLRTLLWQVRNALGREAWRVQRRSGRLSLDLTGVEVDLHGEELAQEERAAAADLAGEPSEPPTDRPPGDRGRPLVPGLTLTLLEGWDVVFPPSLRSD